MDNEIIVLEITPAQLTYLWELVTLDVALSLMKLGKIETPKVKEMLAIRTNANKTLLRQLKAKKDEATKTVPANSR